MALKEPTDRDLWHSLSLSWLLIFLAIAIPLLALILPFPQAAGLDRAGWFSRSGALTTVFAILAEGVLIRAKLSITPAGFGWVGLQELRDEFIPKFNAPEWLIFTLTVIGTLIWGYGDIPFNVR